MATIQTHNHFDFKIREKFNNDFNVYCRFCSLLYIMVSYKLLWRLCRKYSDLLQAGRSWDRIPERERFYWPVRTCYWAHSASCTNSTGPLSEENSGCGMVGRAKDLSTPLYIYSVLAYSRMKFTFTF